MECNYLLVSIKDSKIKKVVELDDINFFQKINNLDVVINTDFEEIVIRKRLKDIEKNLSNNLFFIRTHKSFIINIKKVKCIVPRNSQNIVFFKNTDKKSLVSRNYNNSLQELFLNI